MLEDNRTLADYNIQEDSTIQVGYLYNINFEGVIYQKAGTGCSVCCGGDLFGFLSSKTGIPREELYLVNGSEIILDKDFDVRNYNFDEYYFKTKSTKIIRINLKGKKFYTYIPEKLDYDLLLESIAKGYFSNYLKWKDCDGIIKKFKNRLTKFNLLFNGKIIDKSEDFSKIENLNEIIIK